MKLPPAFSATALLVFAACSSSQTNGTNPSPSGGVPSGGAAAAGAAGSAGVVTVAGSTAGGASGSTSVGGSGGTTPAGSGAGAGGALVGGAGGIAAGGSAAGTAGTGGTAGGAGIGGAGVGGGVAAGCTADPHPLCIDFESGLDKATWTGGNDNSVSTMDKAHGTHSYHAYAIPDGGFLTTTKLGTITNDIWGRFYLRMTPGNKNAGSPAVPAGTPGAPGGHGNIVGAFEGGAWYELGWQFNGLMGNWHNGGENPLRGHPDILDQWYCVEVHFDGTKTNLPSWYIDGTEAQYYMGEPNNPTKPHVITKFDKITIGFTSYAGLGIAKDPYGNNNDPVMTDMWLDDIAFDIKRIGCIAP